MINTDLHLDIPKARIKYIYPQTIMPGTLFLISGYGFGNIPGKLLIGKKLIDQVLTWHDKSIWFRIPENVSNNSTVTVGSSISEQKIHLAPRGSIRVIWRLDLAEAQSLIQKTYDLKYNLDQIPRLVEPLYMTGRWVKYGRNFGDYARDWDEGSKIIFFKDPETEIRISECVFTPKNLETFGNKSLEFVFRDYTSKINLDRYVSDAAFILRQHCIEVGKTTDGFHPAVLISEENPHYDLLEKTITLDYPLKVNSTTGYPAAIERDRIIDAPNFLPEWKTLKGIISYQQDGNILTLYLQDNKSILFYFLSPSIIRIRFNKEGNYEHDYSYAVIQTDFGKVDYHIKETEKSLVIFTAELKICIKKSLFKFSVFKDDILIHEDTKGISWWKGRICSHKKLLNGSRFYGFGEKTGALLKNGSFMTMWNTDFYRYDKKQDPIYLSIPFFIEINNEFSCGLFFDNTYQSYFNMGQSQENEYYFGALKGDMNYYFIYGHDSKEVIRQYTALTGRMPMLPKWILGYQQCRWGYNSAEKINNITLNFREKKMPCDAVYLDIDYMDEYKSFTWNKKRFPDPANFLKNLKAQGFKTISIIDPGVKIERGFHVYDSGIFGDHFIKLSDESIYKGVVWPGWCAFPDFTKPETRVWWGALYQSLLDINIDGFWNDMNEPGIFNTSHHTMSLDALHFDFGQKSLHAKIHNVYGLLMVKATYEGLNRLRPHYRNFVITRSGYAGLQRYCALVTLGDNVSNWEHLKLTIPMVINLGLSGIPISGGDIGGFVGSPSAELFARWMELGSLIPLYRGHSDCETPDQEPWAFGEKIEDISRKYLELRYKMIHYLYDLTYEASNTGIPVIRPLFLEFPDDDEAVKIEDSFLLGDSLLVAPVIKENNFSRHVYLPKGVQWYDYWTGKVYPGGKNHVIAAPLDKLPLFVRAGAIIPTQEVVQYISEKPVNPITLQVYPGSDYEYTLYLDDENTRDYQSGKFRKIKIEHFYNEKKQVIVFTILVDGFIPVLTGDYFYLNFMKSKMPFSVLIDARPVPEVKNWSTLLSIKSHALYYESRKQNLVVKVWRIKDGTKVVILPFN